MKKLIIFLFAFFAIVQLSAQYIIAFHTENNDSFREWIIEVEIDSMTVIEGELELTWGIGNDFSSWQYSIGEIDGEIIQKYDNNPSFWELRQGSDIVSMTRTWPNDPTSWKIKMGKQSFTIKSKFGNTVDEWENRETDKGDLIIYTEREGDPRDWLVDDYMNDEISLSMRMAATFIAIFSSTPKI
jgi:hypothetical protein